MNTSLHKQYYLVHQMTDVQTRRHKGMGSTSIVPLRSCLLTVKPMTLHPIFGRYLSQCHKEGS
jgi:hypothetical protein